MALLHGWGDRVRSRSRAVVEGLTGIEPALSAWEAEVLPLNYSPVRLAAPGQHNKPGRIRDPGRVRDPARVPVRRMVAPSPRLHPHAASSPPRSSFTPTQRRQREGVKTTRGGEDGERTRSSPRGTTPGQRCHPCGGRGARTRAVASKHDRSRGTQQEIRGQGRRRRRVVHGPPRHRHGLPRPERRRQVDHHAHDRRAGPAERGTRHGQRPGLPPAARAAHRGGRAARRQGGAHRPHRPQPPARARRDARAAVVARRRGHRDHGHRIRLPQARGQVLPGHGAAARHRRSAARRPAHADPGRAGQRPRPRGRALGAPVRAARGERGTHRAALQPPDERDGADCRPRHRARPRPSPRGRPAARPRPRLDHGPRARTQPARRRTRSAPCGAGHRGRDDRRGDARYRRPRGLAHRRLRRRTRYPPARAHPDHRVARGCLPRPHRRVRRIPHPRRAPAGAPLEEVVA